MSPPDKPKGGRGGVSPRAKLAGFLAIGTVVVVMFAMPALRKQPAVQQPAASSDSTKQGEWTPGSAAAGRTEGADSVNRPQLPSFDGASADKKPTPPPPLANENGSTGNNAAGRVRALLSENGAGGLATSVTPGSSPPPVASHSDSAGPPVPISSNEDAWSSTPMPLGPEGSGPGQGGNRPLTPQEQFAIQVIEAREKAFMKAITSKIPVNDETHGASGPPVSQAGATLQGLQDQRQAIEAERASDGKEYQQRIDRMRQLAGTGGTAYHPGADPGSGSLSYMNLVLRRPAAFVTEETL